MPVCKNCLNYCLNFPCPHCGGDLSLTERSKDEIKPIVAPEYQADFSKEGKKSKKKPKHVSTVVDTKPEFLQSLTQYVEEMQTKQRKPRPHRTQERKPLQIESMDCSSGFSV